MGRRSSDGERQVSLDVTCSGSGLSPSPSRPTAKGKISFSIFLSSFYKMTLDDESDSFRGEVSSWRDNRDETYISTIHAILIIFGEYHSVHSYGH